MKRKNLLLKFGIGVCSVLTASSLAVGLFIGIKSSQQADSQEILNNKPTKVEYDNQIFDSKKDAFEYAKSQLKPETIACSNLNLYSLKLNNATYIFETSEQLNNFIESQIKTINTQSDFITASDESVLNTDNSILNKYLPQYNIDPSEIQSNPDQTIDLKTDTVQVYQSNNGLFKSSIDNLKEKSFETKEGDLDKNTDANSSIDAENRAKDTYLAIHETYYFNGIYFKSKQDLEIYIKSIYIPEYVSLNKNKKENYKKIKIATDSSDKTIISNPINFESVINSAGHTQQEKDNLKLEIERFLNSNANRFIKVKGASFGNGETSYPNKYININNDNVDFTGALTNIEMKDLPVIGQQSNKNKALFMIDAQKDEEFNLIGPRFIQASSVVSVENITDLSMWTETTDSPQQMFQSTALDFISSFMDFFFPPTTGSGENEELVDYENRTVGLEPDGTLKDENSLFPIYNNISILGDNLNNSQLRAQEKAEQEKQVLKNAEINMFNELKKVPVNFRLSLYDEFIKMVENLYNMKNFSSIYSIPMMYIYLIENLIHFSAPTTAIISVDNYFLKICELYDDILKSIFGDDFLMSFEDYINPDKLGEKDYFSFAKIFKVGQFNADFNTIAEMVTGNDFTHKYKQLLVGIKIFIDSFGQINDDIKTPVDVINVDANNHPKKDQDGNYECNPIFQLIVEGDKPGQWNLERILEKFLWKPAPDKPSLAQRLEKIWNLAYDLSDSIKENFSKQITILINNKHKTKINGDDLENSINELGQEDKWRNFISELNPATNQIFSQLNDATGTSARHDLILKNSGICDSLFNKKANQEAKKYKKNAAKDLKSINETRKNNKLSDDLKIPGTDSEKFKNELKDEFSDFNLDEETIKSKLKSSNTMSKIKALNKINTVGNAMVAIVNTAASITEIVEQCKAIFDKDNIYMRDSYVRDSVIAAAFFNSLGCVVNQIAGFVPPPWNLLVSAVGGLFSIIGSLIGGPEQKIYEYSIKDGTNTFKYYWDGGLVMKRIFGAITEDIRTIYDAKIARPIQLTYPREKDTIYFNHKAYDVADEAKIRLDCLKWILNNKKEIEQNPSLQLLKRKIGIVYSYEYDAERINDDKNSGLPINVFDSLENFADSIINYVKSKSKSNSYIVDLDNNETFFNGVYYESRELLEANFKKDIIDKIKPTFVAKLPDVDECNYPLEKQREFHPPFPYFEPLSSNSNNDKIIKKEQNPNDPEMRFISVDSNNNLDVINSGPKFIETCIKIIREKFRNSFNVKSKTVSKISTLNAYKFSDFQTNLRDVQIYSIELKPGDIKFFLNKSDAVQQINLLTRNDDRFKVQNSQINVYRLIDPTTKKPIYFNNSAEFTKWFNTQIKELK